jgi:hypothetical protein
VQAFNSGAGFGVYSWNQGNGVAIVGDALTGGGDAVLGFTNSAASFSIWGINQNTNGTGVAGSGNNLVTVFLPTGSGGAFTGRDVGVFGFARNPTTGTAGGNGGGYFRDSVNAINNCFTYAASWNAGTAYKVVGSGAASTIIQDENGTDRVMFCPEAPEVLFEDYGIGQLSNGSVYIKLDPIFALNVKIDEEHPMKVFIQLEGDCNGVYVDLKSAEGFQVKELAGGHSNVNFSWHVVANRADSRVNGQISSLYEDVRLPVFIGGLNSPNANGQTKQATPVQAKPQQPLPQPGEKPKN